MLFGFSLLDDARKRAAVFLFRLLHLPIFWPLQRTHAMTTDVGLGQGEAPGVHEDVRGRVQEAEAKGDGALPHLAHQGGGCVVAGLTRRGCRKGGRHLERCAPKHGGM